MERGSYSKLDQFEIELTANVPTVSSVEPSDVSFSGGTQTKRIDYVLVHEILKDTKELDDDSVEEIRKLACWRDTFERCLENKLGLVLQRKVVDIENVSVIFAFFLRQLVKE